MEDELELRFNSPVPEVLDETRVYATKTISEWLQRWKKRQKRRKIRRALWDSMCLGSRTGVNTLYEEVVDYLRHPPKWTLFCKRDINWDGETRKVKINNAAIGPRVPVFEEDFGVGLHSLLDGPLLQEPPYSMEVIIAHAIAGSPCQELAQREIHLLLMAKFFWFEMMGGELLGQQVAAVLRRSNYFEMARDNLEHDEVYTRWKLADGTETEEHTVEMQKQFGPKADQQDTTKQFSSAKKPTASRGSTPETKANICRNHSELRFWARNKRLEKRHRAKPMVLVSGTYIRWMREKRSESEKQSE